MCLAPRASSQLAKTYAFCYVLLASYRLASEPLPAHGNMNKPRVNWHAHNTRTHTYTNTNAHSFNETPANVNKITTFNAAVVTSEINVLVTGYKSILFI